MEGDRAGREVHLVFRSGQTARVSLSADEFGALVGQSVPIGINEAGARIRMAVASQPRLADAVSKYHALIQRLHHTWLVCLLAMAGDADRGTRHQ